MLSSLLKSRLGSRSWGNSSSSLSSWSPAAPLLSSTPVMTGTSGRTGWDSRLCWLVKASVSSALSSLWVKLSAWASACGTAKYNIELHAGVSAALYMIESILQKVWGMMLKVKHREQITPPMLNYFVRCCLSSIPFHSKHIIFVSQLVFLVPLLRWKDDFQRYNLEFMAGSLHMSNLFNSLNVLYGHCTLEFSTLEKHTRKSVSPGLKTKQKQKYPVSNY